MCYDSICMVERVQQVSLNVMHHSENPIKWHECSASSVLFRLRSIPFWKLKLALKGRRFGDSSTIQKQSAVRTVKKMVDTFITDRALTLLVRAGRSIGLRCVCEECGRPMYRPISFKLYSSRTLRRMLEVFTRLQRASRLVP